MGVLFGLLALGAIAALIHNLIDGSTYRIFLAAGEAAFLGSIAYAVGVEVPRHVRAWDPALADRKRVRGIGR